MKILNRLDKLGEKGWDVLAPLGSLAGYLSKTTKGAKAIELSKIGLKSLEKFKKISKFLKLNPVFREFLGYAGDGLTVIGASYDEFVNPDSPAYGNASMSVYGGINSFLWDVGPLEGAQYGGLPGATVGTANTIIKMGKDGINSIVQRFNGPKLWSYSSEDKRKWLDEQYKEYGVHKTTPGDETYRVGIQPASGSPSFNPNNVNNNSNGYINSNKSPSQQWGSK